MDYHHLAAAILLFLVLAISSAPELLLLLSQPLSSSFPAIPFIPPDPPIRPCPTSTATAFSVFSPLIPERCRIAWLTFGEVVVVWIALSLSEPEDFSPRATLRAFALRFALASPPIHCVSSQRSQHIKKGWEKLVCERID